MTQTDLHVYLAMLEKSKRKQSLPENIKALNQMADKALQKFYAIENKENYESPTK